MDALMAFELGHVVITGAAGAIGSALARKFAERFPRVRLALVDVDDGGLGRAIDSLPRAAAEKASRWVWDLSKPESLPAAWEALVAAHGAPDGLVNCAGIMHVQSLVGTSWSTGARLVDIDLVSPLRLMSLAAPAMVERGAGVIVNVSSMAGRVPLRGCTFYGGAKAGIAMASEIAHLELAPSGVRVVTVYPGPVASALERGARAQLTPTLISRIMPVGDPAEVADLTIRAIDRKEARVVSPPFYRLADRSASRSG
jgi:dehydrogenase/reductase SDR family member 7B